MRSGKSLQNTESCEEQLFCKGMASFEEERRSKFEVRRNKHKETRAQTLLGVNAANYRNTHW